MRPARSWNPTTTPNSSPAPTVPNRSSSVFGDGADTSNDQAADALRELNPQNLRTLLLAHLSSQCNADYLAVEAMARALRDLHRADITLAALAQDEPSALYEF